MDKPVNVSIVLYETNIKQLNDCLKSLEHSDCINAITLLDNSKKQLNLDNLYKPSVAVNYIHNNDNLGYGTAHNIAIRDSIDNKKIFYHLVINADVSFDKKVIDKCFNFMESNLDVGNLIPSVLYPDGRPQYLCKLIPSPFDFFIRVMMPNRIKKLHERHFALSKYGYESNFFAPYLSGCFMFLRISTLKEVGLFDERFFLYGEDLDLSRRIASISNQLFFFPATIYHGHGSGWKKSFIVFRYMLVNMFRYYAKWGWIHDKSRKYLNKKTLNQFKT